MLWGRVHMSASSFVMWGHSATSPVRTTLMCCPACLLPAVQSGAPHMCGAGGLTTVKMDSFSLRVEAEQGLGSA